MNALTAKLVTHFIHARWVYLYTVIAYLFGLGVRLLLMVEAKKHPEFMMDETTIIPLWTADAGLYGFYAKNILAGVHYPLESEYMLGHFIAWCVATFSSSLDSVMFYLPAFLAPLIVIPIVGIMHVYKRTFGGFIAALIASIGFNYYYRSHLGYTDTDLLIYTLTLFCFYALILVREEKNIFYVLLGVASTITLLAWYHSSFSMLVGLFILIAICIVVFDRKAKESYVALLLLFMCLLPLSFIFKMVLVFGVLAGYKLIEKRFEKWLDYRLFLLLGALFIGVILLRYPEYYAGIFHYIQKQNVMTFHDVTGKVFTMTATLNTIAESGGSSLLEMVNATAGNSVFYTVSLIGFCFFILHHRSVVLLLPLLILGFASIKMGIRFTTFAVPVIAMGIAFFILFVADLIQERRSKIASKLFVSVLMVGAIGYTLLTVVEYHKVLKPVFVKEEVLALKQASLVGKKEDYLVSWWDNGWPVWYFTPFQTMTDNGRHFHDNFIISTIMLCASPIDTVNFSRYFFGIYHGLAMKGVSTLTQLAKTEDIATLIWRITKNEVPLPQNAFDVYYFFNDGLIDKLPVIESFLTIDEKGKRSDALLLYSRLSKPFSIKEPLMHGLDFTFDRSKGIVKDRFGKEGKVSGFFISNGDKFQFQRYYADANYNIILYKDRDILIVDNYYLNSFFIKAFILNTYDKNLFELVAKTQSAKVFKLKKAPSGS